MLEEYFKTDSDHNLNHSSHFINHLTHCSYDITSKVKV
jgi:hypothetical protein